MSRPSYSTRDPKGWGGDPKRGAALGRGNLYGDAEFSDKLTLRRVYLDSGGFDTYGGLGAPLYWYASDCGTIDGTLRARTREAAKAEIREDYPNARFWR